jgi:hypothetical protein
MLGTHEGWPDSRVVGHPYRGRLCGKDRSDRDRGMPDSSTPPTPPDMRVRIRRFGGLSDGFHGQSRNPERVEVNIGQCDAERGRVRQPPRTVIAARRLSGQVSIHTPTRNSANCAGPRFHCFQIADRSLRRCHCSRPVNTDGVSHLPK